MWSGGRQAASWQAYATGARMNARFVLVWFKLAVFSWIGDDTVAGLVLERALLSELRPPTLRGLVCLLGAHQAEHPVPPSDPALHGAALSGGGTLSVPQRQALLSALVRRMGHSLCALWR